MKWLLLLVLIACGHEQPPARDVTDSDGDHVLNYLEESDELKKFTAHIRPFKEIKATLTFRKEMSLVTLDLSNESNLTEVSYRLLTKRADLLKLEDHFSEWSKLRLVEPPPKGDLTARAYDFTLRFDESSDRPDYIELGNVRLGSFQKVMKFQLSGQEAKDLLAGKTHLNLKRKEDTGFSQSTTIRQRTYRLFWNDGRMTQVYYVSKELPLNRFIALKKIEQIRNAEEIDGLGWSDEHEDWWYREIGDTDKVLVKASERKIAEAKAANYTKQSGTVKRVNGKSQASMILTKSPDARVILKLRAKNQLHSFEEKVHKKKRGGGHEEPPLSCYYYERKVVPGPVRNVTAENIIKNIVIKTELQTYTFSELIENARESLDEKGPYLEIHMAQGAQDIQVLLPNRNKSTFTKTGIYQWYCENPRTMKFEGTVTNEEGHFTIKADAFIEKLED